MPSRPTRSALLAAVALAALGACADPAHLTAPTGTIAASRVPSELNSPNRHIFHTREYFAREDASNGGARYARTTSGSGTGISYHGGSVLQSGTHVVAIYWGRPGYASLPSAETGPGSSDGSLIGTFLTNLSALTDAAASKNYFNINHTYWGPGGSATTNLIAPTVSYTAFWNTAATTSAPQPSASPTDADMIALINWGFTHGKITYDASAIFAIFTASGVNLGGGFGSQYCAYHTHGTDSSNGQTFYYAAMPYNQQYVSGCTSGYASPNTDVAANSEVNTLAHEIEETTTDDMGNAWYDSRGYENGDKCAWTWGTTKTANGGVYNQQAPNGGPYFLVQQNWLNAGSGGCTTGY